MNRLLATVSILLFLLASNARAGDRHKATVSLDLSALRVDPEPEHAAEVQKILEEDFLDELRKSLLDGAEPSAQVAITVRWKDYNVSIYEVRITATVTNKTVEPLVFEVQGVGYDISSKIKAEVPRIMQWLERAPGAAPPRTSTPHRISKPIDPKMSRPEAVGIALAAAGVVALVPSAIVLALRTDDGPQERRLSNKSLRTSYMVVSAVGVTVGVGLVAAGLGTFIQGRLTRKSRTATRITPALTPSMAGALITGRF